MRTCMCADCGCVVNGSSAMVPHEYYDCQVSVPMYAYIHIHLYAR